MIGRLVVLLFAANLVWLAWSQGWLSALGLGPQVQTEPERLERQINPDALRVQPLPPASHATMSLAPSLTPPPSPAVVEPAPAPVAVVETPPQAPDTPASPPAPASLPPAPAAAAPPPPAMCLQAGVFDERQAAVLRQAAASLPAGSWRMEEVQLPGRWMVYVGKLADASAVAARRAEIRALGVDTDRPGGALEPGLSLGRFSSEEAAQRGLADLTRKGVRAARVVQERRNTPGYMLRLPKADEALRQRAATSLRNALAGRQLRACE